MRVRPYKQTSLWRQTLEPRPGCPHDDLRSRLAGAYEAFRERAGALTNEIHALLPNLTVHNVDHLDALWDVASAIAGDDYPLSPLEAFVLGGAILTHDAGMALSAYPGRMDDIRRHPRWVGQRKAAWARRGVEGEPSADQVRDMQAEVEQEATFDIVRAEHAHVAETLLTTWKTSDGLWLLPDDDLRQSYGKLIGEIAASHHWSVNDLARRLPKGFPAAAPFPRDWAIDPIKIACLLRCADAANIDDTRAPSFVYGLRRPNKVSRQHWEFQNRLIPADRQGDGLLFRSKKKFAESDAAVWWLCFETLKMCSEQLAQSDALLRDEGRPRFAVRSVIGADYPLRAAETVEVTGWRPVDTTVRISDVVGLVGKLGGKQLYGDDPLVPLRELIQNAADAIRARRRLDRYYYEGKPAHERGEIFIRLADDTGPDAAPDKFWLTVEDDGIGMSQPVLTGPLLDFGTSFWRSAMAGEELPGLAVGDGFEPTGQFGIGFYSVFMYADRVRVTSRPVDTKASTHGAAKTLEFKEGLSSRALLREYRPADDGPLGGTVSTRVAIRLPREIMKGWRQAYEHRPETTDIATKLRWLVLGLDVVVSLQQLEQPKSIIHEGSYIDLPAEEFLRRAALASPDDRQDEIRRLAALVRPIVDDDGRCLGRAVSHLHATDESIASIGGLSSIKSDMFWGVLAARPSVAARNRSTPRATDEQLATWAREQASILGGQGWPPMLKNYASYGLFYRGVDACDVLYCNTAGGEHALADAAPRIIAREGFVLLSWFARWPVDAHDDVITIYGVLLDEVAPATVHGDRSPLGGLVRLIAAAGFDLEWTRDKKRTIGTDKNGDAVVADAWAVKLVPKATKAP